MFLIKKGACAVVEDIAFHLESLDMLQKVILMPFKQVVDVWKQTLVLRVK